MSAWNMAVPPPAPSTSAQLAFPSADQAVYKGIAQAKNGTNYYLYLADFHNGKIDVLDSTFTLTHLSGSFTDPNLPSGYAPFNVAALNGNLYVSYALQDAAKHDDVSGKGHGFIDIFDLNGAFQKRLVSAGDLNSPWGMVIAPNTATTTFGDFSGDLLVGNFGDGRIHAYDPTTGVWRARSVKHPATRWSSKGCGD